MSEQGNPLVEIDITEDMRNRMHKLRSTMPASLSKSFSKGQNTIYGCAGEIIVLDYIGGNFVGGYDYDIIIENPMQINDGIAEYYRQKFTPEEGKAVRIEVKSKRVKTAPQLFYSNSILRFSSHQDCDCYIFVRILEDLSKAWLCGACTPQWFFKGATFHAKGDFDINNGFTFPADMWNRNIGCFAEGEDKNGSSYQGGNEDQFGVQEVPNMRI